jgi:site-specific recombinase XerD
VPGVRENGGVHADGKEARVHCTSLQHKRISPHVLRDFAAMELLRAGVVCSVIGL